ncbi:MAG: hypothetical protein GX427_06610 [Actinomycetales bacterium]|nr:hypothetical protein [Actinomycetales bacterium]
MRPSPVDDDHAAGDRTIPGSVVPTRAAEDTDIAWGDAPDSNDRRLREDVPPHW